MDKVYESGAVAIPPTPPANPSIGYPSRGNALAGVMPTVTGPYLMHQMVEELSAVITAGGLVPNHLVLNQVRQALDNTYMKRNGYLATAAFNLSLPNLSFVDAIISLASDDYDGGAWRKIFADKSWGTEALTTGRYWGVYASVTAAVTAGAVAGDYYYNSTNATFEALTSLTASVATYRMGTQEFPADALITAEAQRVIIWDISQGLCTPWMVFLVGGGAVASANHLFGGVLSSLAMLNGTLFVGGTYAMPIINFPADKSKLVWQSSTYGYVSPTISMRNAGAGAFVINQIGLNNSAVNDIAVTVLPDAPIDSVTNLPVPTIYAATPTGVSRIAHDGTVTSTTTSATVPITQIYTDDKYVYALAVFIGGMSEVCCLPIASALPVVTNSWLSGSWTTAVGAFCYYKAGAGNFIWPTNQSFSSNVGSAFGHGAGLILLKHNPANETKYFCANVTNTYNTGWMVGDTKFAIGYDSASVLADKSVKAGVVNEVGVLTKTPVAGGLTTVSGFGAGKYIEMPTSANFNALGAADVMLVLIPHAKFGTAGTLKCLASFGSGISAGSFELQHTAANTLSFLIHNGTALTAIATSTATFTDAGEHMIEVKRCTLNGVANTLQILVDGIVVASAVSTLTVSNATGTYRIGEAQAASRPWLGGSYAGYARCSATAHTAEQSAFVAQTENALNGGQPCLLSNSATVSALSYNKARDVLLVGNGTNVDEFTNLKRNTFYAHGVTALKALSASDGVKAIAGTGATVAGEARNIAGELNTLRRKYAALNQKAIPWSKTSSAAGRVEFPQGFKPIKAVSTAGAYVSLSVNPPKPDGFIWYMDTGLAASTAYDFELISA
ncbi:MAG: hypothetical protein AB1400_05655 [Pseudomonadota bacterium]